MMGDSYCPFPERLSAQFTEIDSDVMMSLSESNPEYAALKDQMEDLKRQNPCIATLMEGDGELHLSTEEHETLKEFIRLYMQADNLEREQLYFRGHADGFAYLKMIDAFRTE